MHVSVPEFTRLRCTLGPECALISTALFFSFNYFFIGCIMFLKHLFASQHYLNSQPHDYLK